MSTSSSVSYSVVPPIGHALGGAIGSALALLLFYPLERARIEMQSSASSSSPATLDLKSQEGLPKVSVAVEVDNSKSDKEHFASLSESSSSESWVSCVTEPNETTTSVVVPTCSKNDGLLPTLCNLYKSKELYQGAGSVVVTLATSSFVFFYAHQWIATMILQNDNTNKRTKHKSSSALLSLFGSSLAGAINVLITNPMWVANLRIIKGDAKQSVWREMKTIVQQEGWKSLWNGTGTSLLLVSNPVLQFFCYEQCKASRLKGRATLSPMEAFCIGALAKAIATIATYPLQLAQVLLRLEKGVGTWDCLKSQYEKGGVNALYTGLNAKLMQTVLTAAFTFLTYEQILRVVRAALLITAQKKTRLSSNNGSVGLANSI